MRLGIYTRYYRHDAAYLALRIAEWAFQVGWDVSLFTDCGRAHQLHPSFDRAVHRDGPRGFTDWAEGRDVIVWTHCPVLEQVSWTKRHEKRAVLIPLAHELDSKDRRVLKAASAVGCTSRNLAMALKNYLQVSTTTPLLFDPGLPLTLKPTGLAPALRLLLPLFEQRPDEVDEDLLHRLILLHDRRDDFTLTVACSSSKLHAGFGRTLRQAVEVYPRIQRCRQLSLKDRPFLFATHDLTLWPTRAENTGLIGLTSLAMGTPVIAFNGPPLQEFLTSRNAVLIPCTTMTSALGVPTIKGLPAKFEEYLTSILDDRRPLERMLATVHFNLEHRRQIFDAGLRRVLTGTS